MNNRLLLGLWRTLAPIPARVWQREVARDARATTERLGFMSDDHHRIRDMAVTDLPRIGAPLPPEHFAQELDLPPQRVTNILDELERNMTFLFRNREGAVTWAYPVTVERTPHHVTFGSGEKVFAA